MNQGTDWGILMKKNRSQKSRASVPLNLNTIDKNGEKRKEIGMYTVQVSSVKNPLAGFLMVVLS